MVWAIPEIIFPLIIAVLLGLLIGWFMWRWRRTKISYNEWEVMRQQARRGRAGVSAAPEADPEAVMRLDLDRVTDERDRMAAERDQLRADLAACREAAAGETGKATADPEPEAAQADDAHTADEAVEPEIAPMALSGAAPPEEPVSPEEAPAREAATLVEVRRVIGRKRHPYGAGSHAPFADAKRAQPTGYPIKGNVSSMLYHRPDSRNYGATGAEVWFDTPGHAEASGFSLAPTHPTTGVPEGMVLEEAPRPSDAALAAEEPDHDDERTPPANDFAGGDQHPFGDGSHAPFVSEPRRQPDGFPIKGNTDSMLYHRPDSRNYGATVAEVWFDTAERAEKAGFALAPTHPKA